MSTPQKPSPGRIVHIFDTQLEAHTPQHVGPYPAIVTFVHPDGSTVDASAFPTGTIGDVQRVPIVSNVEGHSGTIWWQWPERVS